MKHSIYVLCATGACAAVAAFLGSVFGFREDFGSAIGGVAGFVIANGVLFALRGSEVDGGMNNAGSTSALLLESGFAYGVFAIIYFSLVGWFTGYVHEHGEFAGTVCGGLGGFIVAVIVPAIHGSSFMSAGRKLQIAFSVVAFIAILGILWVMYEHEIR